MYISQQYYKRVLFDQNADLKVSYTLEQEKILQNTAKINDCYDKRKSPLKSVKDQVQIPLVQNELEILPKQNQVEISAIENQVRISPKKNENISERQDNPEIPTLEKKVQNQANQVEILIIH